MSRFWRNNGLSLVLFVMFAVTLLGQSMVGHRHENQQREDHGKPAQSWTAYVASPAFLEVTMENWESEFLQMGVYVLLTAFLFQKGSSESKDPEGGEEEVDRQPDPNRKGAPWAVRKGGFVLALYKNSLGLALTLLFLVSFVLHAVGGAGEYNEEQRSHGGETVSVLQYVGTSRFWFESLQNWQSEFLAIFTMVVLSIFLRQHGSPESKPVDAAHDETGSG